MPLHLDELLESFQISPSLQDTASNATPSCPPSPERRLLIVILSLSWHPRVSESSRPTTSPLYSRIPFLYKSLLHAAILNSLTFFRQGGYPPFPTILASDLGQGKGALHLVRPPARNPTDYQFLCNRTSSPMIIPHFLTFWCDWACQGHVKSLCFGRSLNQNRYRPVSILIQGA
jgi:hypothetical protein